MCKYCIAKNCKCDHRICDLGVFAHSFEHCTHCMHNIHIDAKIIVKAKKQDNPEINKLYELLYKIAEEDEKFDTINFRIKRKDALIGISAAAGLLSETEFLEFKDCYKDRIIIGDDYKSELEELKNDLVEFTSVTCSREKYKQEADKVLEKVKRLEYIRGK